MVPPSGDPVTFGNILTPFSSEQDGSAPSQLEAPFWEKIEAKDNKIIKDRIFFMIKRTNSAC